MQIEVMLLASSFLITLILLGILIAIVLRFDSNPKKTKKVSQDLKKIKDQINGE